RASASTALRPMPALPPLTIALRPLIPRSILAPASGPHADVHAYRDDPAPTIAAAKDGYAVSVKALCRPRRPLARRESRPDRHRASEGWRRTSSPLDGCGSRHWE